MKEALRYGLILSIICLISGGLLAGVNILTKNKIFAQAQKEEEMALKEVLPEADYFKEVKSDKETLYYLAYDKDKKLIGVAFKAKAKGYASLIETLVGMSLEGEIKTIKVISQNETPGLGAKITEAKFSNQFKDKKINELGQIQAITGATISSRAVINSVKNKAEEIKESIKDVR